VYRRVGDDRRHEYEPEREGQFVRYGFERHSSFHLHDASATKSPRHLLRRRREAISEYKPGIYKWGSAPSDIQFVETFFSEVTERLGAV
jgi:hypothetical protein